MEGGVKHRDVWDVGEELLCLFDANQTAAVVNGCKWNLLADRREDCLRAEALNGDRLNIDEQGYARMLPGQGQNLGECGHGSSDKPGPEKIRF